VALDRLAGGRWEQTVVAWQTGTDRPAAGNKKEWSEVKIRY
jgi:hypothetical protein